MSSHRRRRYRKGRSGYGEARKPQSLVSKAVIVGSAISLVLFGAAMAYSGFLAGETANWFGGVAVLILMAAIVCLILAVREFRNPAYEPVTKTVALVAGIVSCFAWGTIYLIGMFVAS